MKERRRKELEAIMITGLDSRGRGRGVHTLPDGQERPVAVNGALPGDVVDVRVRRRKAGTILGDVLRLIQSERPRVEPFCLHFGECGGCTLQDLAYRDQLSLKEATVRAAFREAGLPDGGDTGAGVFRPALPAPRERLYRNKLEYSFGAQRWLTDREVREAEEIADRRGLGFHAPGRFDRVLDLSECHLQPEPSESIRRFLGEFTRERGLSFYDAREHCGVMRLLIVRTSLTGEVMVTVMFGEDDPGAVELVMSALAERFPGITSLNYVVNTGANDSIFPHEVMLYRGEPFITERCGPNRLRIRPKAFYQTNPEQAVRLYEAALTAGLGTEPGAGDPTRLAFDLYSGIGSIALLLARRVERVVGIESVPDAVRAARENAELNGIGNADFLEGQVETLLSTLEARYGTPDLVVVDPPRVGVHRAARKALLEIAPPRIVYVSCNARSQATDIQDLADRYEVKLIQPVDMFPQTRHVETVVLLERRG
ncbi:MAG: 23S rRNA (uracil(1939)-C(5))-methyltransferase RlmD [Spirochaetaceae bacterium]|nr:MAG: 23S rRNA (uracil(1939)-C(5))-methyltransferase RlmD [Spirochaetaceae bacterium]